MLSWTLPCFGAGKAGPAGCYQKCVVLLPSWASDISSCTWHNVINALNCAWQNVIKPMRLHWLNDIMPWTLPCANDIMPCAWQYLQPLTQIFVTCIQWKLFNYNKVLGTRIVCYVISQQSIHNKENWFNWDQISLNIKFLLYFYETNHSFVTYKTIFNFKLILAHYMLIFTCPGQVAKWICGDLGLCFKVVLGIDFIFNQRTSIRQPWQKFYN